MCWSKDSIVCVLPSDSFQWCLFLQVQIWLWLFPSIIQEFFITLMHNQLLLQVRCSLRTMTCNLIPNQFHLVMLLLFEALRYFFHNREYRSNGTEFYGLFGIHFWCIYGRYRHKTTMNYTHRLLPYNGEYCGITSNVIRCNMVRGML